MPASLYAINPSKRRRGGKKHHARRHALTGLRRNASRRRRSGFSLFRRNPTGGIVGLLKSGAMMGAGGVLNDMLYAQLMRFLPPTMQSPLNADGTTNWSYFLGKIGSAALLGYGAERVINPATAEKLAAGGVSVIAYQVFRGFSGGLGMPMGAYSPAPMGLPRRQMAGLSAYTSAGGNAGAAGATATRVMRAINGGRR